MPRTNKNTPDVSVSLKISFLGSTGQNAIIAAIINVGGAIAANSRVISFQGRIPFP
jgi:hypothetical protein